MPGLTTTCEQRNRLQHDEAVALSFGIPLGMHDCASAASDIFRAHPDRIRILLGFAWASQPPGAQRDRDLLHHDPVRPP